MLNKMMLIGHLGKDPELKYGSSGNPVCTMTLATDEGYTDKDGNKVDRVEWHRIVAYQRLAETCGQYLQKGRLIYVEGKLQTRKWQDQNGQDRYTTEVVAQRVQFLSRKGDPADSSDMPSAAPAGRSSTRPNEENMGPAFPSEAGGMDDVPF
jgi:single-strand DNA-binding protein